MNGWKVRTTSRLSITHRNFCSSPGIARDHSSRFPANYDSSAKRRGRDTTASITHRYDRFEARVIALSRSTGWKLLFWKGGGQPLPVNDLYELSCPFIGRNARSSFSFHPSLPFFPFSFYIYIFFSFFPLFSIERQKRERGKEKNREGQEREAVKRSVYIRVYVYIFYRRQSRTVESTGPPPRSLRVRFN